MGISKKRGGDVHIFGDFVKPQKIGQKESEETLRCRLRCDLGNNLIRGTLWLSFYACCTILISKAMSTPPDQLRCVMDEIYRLCDKIFGVVFVKLFSSPIAWFLGLSLLLIFLVFGFLWYYLRKDLKELHQEIEELKLGKESHADSSSDSSRHRSLVPCS